MPLEIVTVPCLSDNYAYLLRDAASGQVGLVDAPEAGPIEAALAGRNWELDLILITHHHADHVQAVDALRGRAKVVGNAADRARLPRLDVAVSPGDTVALGESVAEVLDVPGHTVGHVAYYFAGRGGALLGGQPDGDGLRAAVRGDAGADVGEPEPGWRRCRTRRWSIRGMSMRRRTRGSRCRSTGRMWR